MWFYIPAAFLLVLALSGGVFAGGISRSRWCRWPSSR
jgi:hypothetical protein